MPKQGVKFDYDLQANDETGVPKKCIICGEENPVVRLTDASGEAICTICGFPYQVKWGTKKQEQEKAYPYVCIKPKWIPIMKQYWDETKQFCFHGRSFREDTGKQAFWEWVKLHHPDKMK